MGKLTLTKHEERVLRLLVFPGHSFLSRPRQGLKGMVVGLAFIALLIIPFIPFIVLHLLGLDRLLKHLEPFFWLFWMFFIIVIAYRLSEYERLIVKLYRALASGRVDL